MKEYRSRQVAVIGIVAKPGLYTLASGSDTILDMPIRRDRVRHSVCNSLSQRLSQPRSVCCSSPGAGHDRRVSRPTVCRSHCQPPGRWKMPFEFPILDLAQKSGVVQGERPVFVKNRLVVIVPRVNFGKVMGFRDLARPDLKLDLTAK